MSIYSIETYGEMNPYLGEEWLLTNGLGGFACGTVLGCATRRYHGLLVAAMSPPVGRVMLLSRIGEILAVRGQADRLLEFSICQFSDRFHPRGDRYLRRFDLEDGLARWDYDVEGIHVVKELLLPAMKNCAGIRYRIEPGAAEVELSLLPFVRLMDFHALRRGRTVFQEEHSARACSVRDGNIQVSLTADGGSFLVSPDWWMGHKYVIETERGQDDTEDLYTPGRFVLSISKPTTLTLWASLENGEALDWEKKAAGRKPAKAAKPRSPMVDRLARAAGDFIVYRKSPDGKDGSTVIAGYPWFADWGRDTMIALPGLFLTTGRFEQAKQVLSVFAQYVSEGMIPNKFDDYSNEPSYNTVDASLWFIHAAFEFARLSGDSRTLEQILRPACRKIIDGYMRGTRFNIRVDPADGLVSQGDSGTQLTWMDAKYGGVCFTPRQGKAVEINALWYHALCLMEEKPRARQVGESFRKTFWLSPFRGLADVVDGSRKDASLRPNQIFAVGLANSPLSSEEQHAVVEAVRRELLTPMGLRTLEKNDPRFHGVYSGPQAQRDEAYHNGTVWPWLMGAFLDAYLKVNQNSQAAREQARRWLMPLLEQMQQACIGQISEIFEGNEPHRPVGAFAQAWSVAEVLRLAVELGM